MQTQMRRFLIAQAEHRAARLLQIQIILILGLVFGLAIAPAWVVVLAYLVMQASELHALWVFRRLLKASHDLTDPLTAHKQRVVEYELGSASAVSAALFLGYATTQPEWTMGVIAIWSIGAIYFMHGTKHDAMSLYGALGVITAFMVFAVIWRGYAVDGLDLMHLGPSLALVAFMGVTLFAIGANVRRDHFKRLDYERELEHAISALNVESAAKSNLLAQLSHEIRTPLNGMLGAAELLSLKGLTDDQSQMLGVMRDSGGHLVDILDRTLEMSAAEVGAISIARREGVLDSLVSEEVALHQGQAMQAGMELSVHGDVCGAKRQIDEVRVRQCLGNLIANAIRHSDGRRISVSCAIDRGDAISLRVVDDGVGVPVPDRERIFGAFSGKGLDDPHTRKGAGLGLAISRAIARAMGGDLLLETSDAGGSTFTLSFSAPLIAS